MKAFIMLIMALALTVSIAYNCKQGQDIERIKKERIVNYNDLQRKAVDLEYKTKHQARTIDFLNDLVGQSREDLLSLHEYIDQCWEELKDCEECPEEEGAIIEEDNTAYNFRWDELITN